MVGGELLENCQEESGKLLEPLVEVGGERVWMKDVPDDTPLELDPALLELLACILLVNLALRQHRRNKLVREMTIH